MYIGIKHLKKTYWTTKEPVCALEDISFDINRNEFIAVVGPSGCGKTTLLKIIAGLVKRSGGEISINGVPLEKSTENIGMVFQTPALLPWRSVAENIMLPIEILRLSKEKYYEKAHSLIKLTKLTGFEDRYPYELSGGMQQRVSISRALIHDPPLLLMDEPFGALDAMTRDTLNIELLRIWQHKKKTVIFVTHNIAEAVYLADRVIVLSCLPAKVVNDVKIDLPRPRDFSIRETEGYLRYLTKVREGIGEYT